MKKGLTYEKIGEKFEWSDRMADKKRRIQDLGLLSENSVGKVGFSYKGNLIIGDQGELTKKINKLQNKRCFEEVENNVKQEQVSYQLYNGSISTETHKQIIARIRDFGEKRRFR